MQPNSEFLALGARTLLVVGLGQCGSDTRLIGFAPGVGIRRLELEFGPK